MGNSKATSFRSLMCQVKVRTSSAGSPAVYIKKGRLGCWVANATASLGCVCSGFQHDASVGRSLFPSLHTMYVTCFSSIPPKRAQPACPLQTESGLLATAKGFLRNVHLSYRFWFLSQSAGAVSLIVQKSRSQ